MSHRSKFDKNQITQMMFDEESEAMRVIMLPTEMSFEGTSEVYTEADGIVSCAGYEYVCLYGSGTVSVSPDDDGETMYELTLTALEPKLICARTIKIVGTGKILIQST
jgi:hypothetical protein